MKDQGKIGTFISKHKLAATAALTATITLALSVTVSISIVSSVKSTYETELTKSVVDTLKRNTSISDTQISELIKKVSVNNSTSTDMKNLLNNESRWVDFSSVKYTFTDDDKSKITDYMISYLNYYKTLQSENDARLNRIYDDKKFYENYNEESMKAGNENLIKYFEEKRKEYKYEIDRMQKVLFDFYHITIDVQN
jgi:hypothetical protein